LNDVVVKTTWHEFVKLELGNYKNNPSIVLGRLAKVTTIQQIFVKNVE
jgi:hypothetical protein